MGDLPRPLPDGTVQSCTGGCRALCASSRCGTQATRVIEISGRRFAMCDEHPGRSIPGARWVPIIQDGGGR